MKRHLQLAAAAAVAALGLAGVSASMKQASFGPERTRQSLVPRSAFLTPSKLVDVRISPAGTLVAFLKREGDTQALWLLDTRTGQRRQLAQHNEATRLHWSANGSWLFLQSSRTLAAVSAADAADGGVLTLLGEESGRSVLGTDTSRADAMLVREGVRRPGHRRASSFRVLRLAPARAPEVLFASADAVDQFIAGSPSFARVIAREHYSIRKVSRVGHPKEVLRCVRLEQCSLLSSPAPGELLLTGDVGGDLERLLHLDAAGKLTTLHQDPERRSDVESVAVDPATGTPVLASYRSAAGADYGVTADARLHVIAIRSKLPPGSLMRVGVGKAAWLVSETSDRLQQPRWHLYEPRSRRLREILADVELPARQVPPSRLADRVPVSFQASDGMTIHGFLALPKTAEPSRLPLVVHVHGGPWSHVEDGYVAMTQFLVSRGYAVYEANFRASTGHGRDYMLAGGREFGNGRVQRDILEGTRALLARGIGHPERVGIMGSSFGGYSALQGVTFAPDLFRVSVAGMPPADFGWVMRWQVEREAALGHEGIGLRQSLKQLDLDPDDSAVIEGLSSQSPLRNVHKLSRPVLIIAGGQDRSVPLRSVVDYSARLTSLGHRVTLFVDPKSGHRVNDPEVQEQYLYLASTMLHQRLGGAAEPAPGSRTALKLRRKLRLDGWALAPL